MRCIEISTYMKQKRKRNILSAIATAVATDTTTTYHTTAAYSRKTYTVQRTCTLQCKRRRSVAHTQKDVVFAFFQLFYRDFSRLLLLFGLPRNVFLFIYFICTMDTPLKHNSEYEYKCIWLFGSLVFFFSLLSFRRLRIATHTNNSNNNGSSGTSNEIIRNPTDSTLLVYTNAYGGARACEYVLTMLMLKCKCAMCIWIGGYVCNYHHKMMRKKCEKKFSKRTGARRAHTWKNEKDIESVTKLCKNQMLELMAATINSFCLLVILAWLSVCCRRCAVARDCCLLFGRWYGFIKSEDIVVGRRCKCNELHWLATRANDINENVISISFYAAFSLHVVLCRLLAFCASSPPSLSLSQFRYIAPHFVRFSRRFRHVCSCV